MMPSLLFLILFRSLGLSPAAFDLNKSVRLCPFQKVQSFPGGNFRQQKLRIVALQAVAPDFLKNTGAHLGVLFFGQPQSFRPCGFEVLSVGFLFVRPSEVTGDEGVIDGFVLFGIVVKRVFHGINFLLISALSPRWLVPFLGTHSASHVPAESQAEKSPFHPMFTGVVIK